MAELSKSKSPKEIDVFNRYTRFNKGRTALIAGLIALLTFVIVFALCKTLMVYTITIIPDGGLVYGKEIEVATYKFLNKTVEPVGFKKEGFYIEGYYRNKDMTDRYEFGNSIWRSETLYVNWQPGYAVQLNFAEGEEEWSNMSLDYLKTYHEQYVKPGTNYTLPIVINDIPYLQEEGETNHEGEQLIWFEDSLGTEPIDVDSYILNDNKPVYGKWFDTLEEKFDIDNQGVLQKYLGYCNKIILPNTVKRIKDITGEFVGFSDQANYESGENVSAFGNVITSLKIVYINEDCDRIGSNAFRDCSALEQVFFKGEKLLSIGYQAFDSCSNLKSIDIPSSVEVIEKKAFFGASNLTTFTGGESIRILGDQVFEGARFKIIELGNVETVGKLLFSGCYELKTIILNGDSIIETTVTDWSNNILFNANDSIKIYVLDELVNEYKTTYPWNEYVDKIYSINDLDA